MVLRIRCTSQLPTHDAQSMDAVCTACTRFQKQENIQNCRKNCRSFCTKNNTTCFNLIPFLFWDHRSPLRASPNICSGYVRSVSLCTGPTGRNHSQKPTASEVHLGIYKKMQLLVKVEPPSTVHQINVLAEKSLIRDSYIGDLARCRRIQRRPVNNRLVGWLTNQLTRSTWLADWLLLECELRSSQKSVGQAGPHTRGREGSTVRCLYQQYIFPLDRRHSRRRPSCCRLLLNLLVVKCLRCSLSE